MTPHLPPFSGFRRSWKRRIANHFQIDFDGVSVSYCYVRKNGCSAFKRLMLDRVGYTGSWDHGLEVMKEHYSASSIADVRAADWRVFVYRDPFSRVVSMFRNKLIMEDGAADLLRDFRDATGMEPAQSTFSDFVKVYLGGRAKDPHTWPQINHLLPVDYNAACTLNGLGAKMTELLGPTVVGDYFVKRANASSDILYDERSVDVPVRELQERYARSRELPSERALGSEELRRLVQIRYKHDYALKPNG